MYRPSNNASAGRISDLVLIGNKEGTKWKKKEQWANFHTINNHILKAKGGRNNHTDPHTDPHTDTDTHTQKHRNTLTQLVFCTVVFARAGSLCGA